MGLDRQEVASQVSAWPARWAATRSVVTFLLGVAVIIDSLVEKNTATVGKLVVGLLLIGIPPVEDIAALVAGRRRPLPAPPPEP